MDPPVSASFWLQLTSFFPVHNGDMTATLEQTQADLRKLLGMVQQGQEVVITNLGRPVAKLTGIPQAAPTHSRKAWIAGLARLRKDLSTGKSGPAITQLVEEDRGV